MVEVAGFRQVTAIASAGSLDKAWLYNGSGSNTLYSPGQPGDAHVCRHHGDRDRFREVFAEGGAVADTAPPRPPRSAAPLSGTWNLPADTKRYAWGGMQEQEI